MTTHLRARGAQAGALLAVVLGGIVVAPAVALADEPEVQITSLPTDVVSGGIVQVGFRVRNTNQGAPNQFPANIKVNGMSCADPVCSQIAPVSADGTDFSVKLKAPTVDAGAVKSVTISVSATIGNDTGTANQPVNVKGPDKPQTVTSVVGKVKGSDGKAISGAAVAMKDNGGHAYQTTTNGSGGYSFNATDSRPITPGNISVGALKDGFNAATVDVQAAAGKSVNVPLTLKALEASASASPSPSASTATSTAATDDEEEAPVPGNSTAADADTKKTSSDSDSGSGSMLFIIIGGLLVAAGIGAIVLVLMRRRNNGEDGGPDDDPTAMPSGAGGAVPPSQGRFNEATRLDSPMAAVNPAAATMVTPLGSSPMADAPTMLHRPVEDEFPDPYGAPPQQPGVQYGAAGYDQGQYGAAQQQYGAADHGYGAPQQPPYGGANSTYGAAAAPAGGQQRYDEPTGMYRPEPGAYDDYDQAAPGQYGGTPAGQYGDQQQYGGGQPAYGGSGYEQGAWDDASGYGPQQSPGQQYDGGYDDHQPGYGAPTTGYADQGAPTGYADQGGQYPAGAGGGQHYGGQGGQYAPGQPYGGYEPVDQPPVGQPPVGQPQGGQPAQGQYGGYGEQPGYEQPGGYDEQNRHGDRRPQEPSHPGQRRSLDWMDN
ncbi:carboxypeptidase regulatory-like domain-containing protein [Paractinoplanes ferrugineus]|uniref:carboxypeptidase regulatory-like domain-containing protein n=1 Tax=Paractinoplanes ferrugineus TaxID=113564 RepID=UPI0019447AF2|nr:carboxypeptidase regulatory-like domain-containing protein [Actinoplanes ferrugineus]